MRRCITAVYTASTATNARRTVEDCIAPGAFGRLRNSCMLRSWHIIHHVLQTPQQGETRCAASHVSVLWWNFPYNPRALQQILEHVGLETVGALATRSTCTSKDFEAWPGGVITQTLWHVRFPRGTLEGAFGSAATTGGLHFSYCTRLSVHSFFSVSSNIIRLFCTSYTENRKKLKQAKKKCFGPVVVCTYTRETLRHLVRL
jgi:hypothetical protein